MMVVLVPLPERSCVRAYASAALKALPRAVCASERASLLLLPAGVSIISGEVDSPIVSCDVSRWASSMVVSARVATIVRRGSEPAGTRRGMDSPARISVCLSEFTLTVGF
jgi:hypothetical protein